MKRVVDTYNCIEGFHFYPNAPSFCSYLANDHRHLFIIRCKFDVQHNNRQVEINYQQKKIEEALYKQFNKPCYFGPMSCEDIAEFLLNTFLDMSSCFVSEDGYGGATLTK